MNKEKTPGRCCHSGYLLPWWLWCALLEVLGTLSKWYVSNPVAKTLVWIENHDWHNCFWMSSWGSPLLDPKKLQNEQFYIIDWIRKKLLVDVANLATCCHDDYDVLYWRFWEPWANGMLVILLPKLWFGLKIMTGTTVFGCLPGAHTLTGPKKASKPTILDNRLNKEKLLVDVANLATCCHDDYDVLLEVLGTLGKCYVSNPVSKTLEIMTGTTVFGCLPGANLHVAAKISENWSAWKKLSWLTWGLESQSAPFIREAAGYFFEITRVAKKIGTSPKLHIKKGHCGGPGGSS